MASFKTKSIQTNGLKAFGNKIPEAFFAVCDLLLNEKYSYLYLLTV